MKTFYKFLGFGFLFLITNFCFAQTEDEGISVDLSQKIHTKFKDVIIFDTIASIEKDVVLYVTHGDTHGIKINKISFIETNSRIIDFNERGEAVYKRKERVEKMPMESKSINRNAKIDSTNRNRKIRDSIYAKEVSLKTNQLEFLPFELGQIHLSYSNQFAKYSSFVLGASFVYARYEYSPGFFIGTYDWVGVLGVGTYAGYQFSYFDAPNKISFFIRPELLYKYILTEDLHIFGGRTLLGTQLLVLQNFTIDPHIGIGYRVNSDDEKNMTLHFGIDVGIKW